MNNNYQFEISKQVFIFEGKEYIKDELNSFKGDLLEKYDDSDEIFELHSFLVNWFDDSDYVEVQTSGSTGVAKKFRAKKNQMMESAKRTCSFLELEKKSSVLLCMPLKFIGAKMIVVRALVAGLDLYYVKSSLNPMKELSFSPNFVAMTPQQASVSLKNEVEKNKLMNVKHLILGGMAVMPQLEKELHVFPNSVWLTYGMTETLSHIALRKLNGKEASNYFTPFENVELKLSESETLSIYAPSVCDDVLTTNDRVEILEDGRFKILGRADNVVNSGGIKIQIEEVEEALSTSFTIPFQLSVLPHIELGEQLVLLTQNPCEDWKERCQNLPKHKIPKCHIVLDKLPVTESGKPDRHTAKKIALELSQK